MSFLKSIFGGSKVEAAPVQYSPPGFSAGGLTSAFSGNNYTVSADGNRSGLISDISSNFRNLGDVFGGLRSTVAPGFNDMLASRLSSLGDTATKAIGDLRQNLASRRILGSSFGQDTLGRLNAEFGRQRDAIVADNFLKSLEASTQLVKQQYDAYNSDFQNKIGELNLEANIANGLTGSAAKILADNAQATAKLQTEASKANATNDIGLASGFGSFLGRAFFPGAK